MVWSLSFFSLFVHHFHFKGEFKSKRKELLERVVLSYGITLVVCSMTLALIDKFPILDDPGVAIKRVILVAFPASFAATVVDSMS